MLDNEAIARMKSPRDKRPVEYNVWRGMIRRCHDPENKDYPRYGGRGIYVCAKWRNDFNAFFEDMGVRPTPKHQIERLKNDQAYHPFNCVWATAQQQANNRRSNVYIDYEGIKQTVSQWSWQTGIGITTIFYRLARGWPINEVLNKPVVKQFCDNGHDLSKTGSQRSDSKKGKVCRTCRAQYMRKRRANASNS